MTGKRSKRRSGTPRIGRPPAGADGEKVKDYPQLSIRLPAEIRSKLQALALVTARPQWRLIADAIECYLAYRPEEERRMVIELIGRRKSRRWPWRGRG